jgi:hypothetical protein
MPHNKISHTTPGNSGFSPPISVRLTRRFNWKKTECISLLEAGMTVQFASLFPTTTFYSSGKDRGLCGAEEDPRGKIVDFVALHTGSLSKKGRISCKRYCKHSAD